MKILSEISASSEIEKINMHRISLEADESLERDSKWLLSCSNSVSSTPSPRQTFVQRSLLQILPAQKY